MKAMHQLKRASVTTKGLLTGSHDAYIRRFQMQLDRFLEDAEKFDEALWEVIHEQRARVYRFLEMFQKEDGGMNGKNMDELKKRWKALRASSTDLSKDIEKGVKSIQKGRVKD